MHKPPKHTWGRQWWVPVTSRARADFQLLPGKLVVVVWESYNLEKPSCVHALMGTVSPCLLPTAQPQGRSCSVGALSAVVRQSWSLGRSESSAQCCCAGHSGGESAGGNAAAGSGLHFRLSSWAVRRGTVLEQLLPCSTCRSPTLHPAGAPRNSLGKQAQQKSPSLARCSFHAGRWCYFSPALLGGFNPFYLFSF